jgi:hypothetical protein
MRKITQNYLKNVLIYNPETGVFTWKNRDSWPNFMNSRLAGKEAGCINTSGYTVIRLHENLYLAHRLAWLYMTGSWPEKEIDHKNSVKSDNRFKNLRNATHAQNKYNCGLSSRNKSGFKGVSWSKVMEKWHSQIVIKGQYFSLGYFTEPEEAHRAYMNKSKQHHGEYSRAA